MAERRSRIGFSGCVFFRHCTIFLLSASLRLSGGGLGQRFGRISPYLSQSWMIVWHRSPLGRSHPGRHDDRRLVD